MHTYKEKRLFSYVSFSIFLNEKIFLIDVFLFFMYFIILVHTQKVKGNKSSFITILKSTEHKMHTN